MTRKATNDTLHKAKSSKSDEFYTLLEDIERELAFYKEQFRGKQSIVIVIILKKVIF